MNVIEMPPRLAALNGDEVTAHGLRLMKCFFKLRSRSRREELIALAERMVEEDWKGPAAPAG